MAALAAVLAAHAFDCGGMITPEQAMQCCGSMPCSTHRHHGQDCCKTMTAVHPPFLQTSAVHNAIFSLDAIAVLPASNHSFDLESLTRTVVATCHAPPILHLLPPVPLRI
jgi:hypothetical protein